MLKIIVACCTFFLMAACFSKQQAKDSMVLPPPPGMVLVPAGNFMMGSNQGQEDELPVHSVKINAFYLDQMEVTNRQFKQFAQETGYKSEGRWERYAISGREGHPVASVTWNDAQAYSTWAGKRLPTEAEWEYAARAGRSQAVYAIVGDGIEINDKFANFGHLETLGEGTNFKLEGIQTTPVSSYEPNSLGLYDMSGNVAEWCSDWFDTSYYQVSPPDNPRGPSFGRGRVLRGGSWNDREDYLRITRRMGMPPGTIAFVFGFRCAANLAYQSK